jgi:hypothetical protein
MYPEDEHVAHPRLYGAPAYARPPQRIAPTAMPLDPDDLPIAVEQTPEERAIAEELLARPFGVGDPMTVRHDPEPSPQPQLLSSIAGKFLRRAS